MMGTMNDSMDGYLSYLKGRIEKLKAKDYTKLDAARAEFNRALDYARRNGQTIRFADRSKEDGQ